MGKFSDIGIYEPQELADIMQELQDSDNEKNHRLVNTIAYLLDRTFELIVRVEGLEAVIKLYGKSVPDDQEISFEFSSLEIVKKRLQDKD